MTDVLTKEQRTKNMQAVRSKETKIETIVAKALWHKGFRFRKNTKELFGKPDLSMKKFKIVIFIDSCFWHGCAEHGSIPENNHSFWLKKIMRNKERDSEVTRYYTENKWNILRVWEHDLKKHKFEETIKKICDFVEKSKQQ